MNEDGYPNFDFDTREQALQQSLEEVRGMAARHLAAKFLDGEVRLSADDEVLVAIISRARKGLS